MNDPAINLQQLAAFLVARRETTRSKFVIYEYRQTIGIAFVTGRDGLNVDRKHEDAARLVVLTMQTLDDDPLWFVIASIMGERHVQLVRNRSTVSAAVHSDPSLTETAFAVAVCSAPEAGSPPLSTLPRESRVKIAPESPARSKHTWRSETGKSASFGPFFMIVVPLIALALTLLLVGGVMMIR